MAAGMIASACRSAGERCENSKGRSELSRLRDRARSLRSHLMGLAEQGGGTQPAPVSPRVSPHAGRKADRVESVRSRVLASEVPLTTAAVCLAVLHVSLDALDRAGIGGIAEIGSAGALAYSGVVGGVLAARTLLAGIDDDAGDAAACRVRAEQMLREAEPARTRITDRVARHLPGREGPASTSCP